MAWQRNRRLQGPGLTSDNVTAGANKKAARYRTALCYKQEGGLLFVQHSGMDLIQYPTHIRAGMPIYAVAICVSMVHFVPQSI